jgi:hypothetical protein
MRNFILGASTVLLSCLSYSAFASCSALQNLQANMANPKAHCSQALYSSLLSQIKYNTAASACGANNEDNSLYSFNLNVLAEECGGLLYAAKMETAANQANAAAAAANMGSYQHTKKADTSFDTQTPTNAAAVVAPAPAITTDNDAAKATESNVFSAPQKSTTTKKNNPWF